VFDPVTGGDDAPVAIVDDGTSLYIVGYDESAGAGDWRWRVEKRSATDGALVSGFGTGGVYTSDPSTGDDRPTAVVHDGTALYVIGYDSVAGAGDTAWRIEKLSMSTGALDGTFGSTTGIVRLDPTTGGDDQALAAVTDGTNLYVVGFDSTAGATDTQWRIRVIDTTNGNPVTAFNTTGDRTWNPSGGADLATSVVHDGTHLYIAGTDSSPGGVGDVQWRCEKVQMSDGSTAVGFGGSGVIASNPSAGVDTCHVVLDGTRLLWGGSVDTTGTDGSWRLETRLLTDGSLDPAFMGTGVFTTNPSPNVDTLARVVPINATRFVWFGTDRTNGATDARWRIELRAR